MFNYEEIPPGHYYKVMREGGSIQRFWHQEKFRQVIQHIKPTDHVLDFGCGPGSFVALLGEEGQFASAVGMDVASGQIDFAIKEIGPRFDNSKVKFVKVPESQVKLPFDDATFDVITSIEVIEHIHPYVVIKLFEELKRVLKPNGRFLITTPNYRSLWPFIEILVNAMSPVKYHEQHINCYTPNSFVKFLETAGLEVTKLESFFIAAPFFTPVSKTLAKSLLPIEKNMFPKLGSLLLAEAKMNRIFIP